MKSDYYLNFENKFRGNRETIINKLSIYDSLIDLVFRENNEISLLDIGCGRGEWLEKWKEKIPNSMGIDQDLNMINLCKSLGLNVLHGQAMEILSKLETSSVSVITIFHMIEHIENDKISLLLNECYRVLSGDGILIIETPSIDNLLVSTKLFYIDSTHINHINPDRIAYEIESLGFIKANYYYINGGPLQNASPLKLTRLLNGVAQDLLIIACKGKRTSDLLFKNNLEWEFELSQAPSTLEAASEYDAEIENLNNEKIKIINDQNKEILLLKESINLLKERIDLLENRQLTIYKLLSPLIKIIQYFKKIIIFTGSKFFAIMINYRITRLILNSKYMLGIIRLCFKILPLESTNISLDKVYYALKKVNQIDIKSKLYNQKLLRYYNHNNSAKKTQDLLVRKIFRKSK